MPHVLMTLFLTLLLWPMMALPSPGSNVAISPDGRTALIGSAYGHAKLWDLSTGSVIRTFRRDEGAGMPAVAISPDGTLGASGTYCEISLWDLKDGKLLRTFDNDSSARNVCDINTLAFSPDGKTLLSGARDWTMRLWDLEKGKVIRYFRGHGGPVNSVAFSADGKTALSGARTWEGQESRTGALRLWDVSTGKLLRKFTEQGEGVNSVAFSPDSKYALSGTYDGIMRFWSLQSGDLLGKYEGYADRLCGVAFLQEGKAVLSSGGTIRVWDLRAGRLIRELSDDIDGCSLAIAPNEAIFVSARHDGSFTLWSLGSLEPLYSRYDGSLIMQAQAALNRLGLYDDKVDGLIGPVTRNAIRRFQREQGIHVDGTASEALISRLGQGLRSVSKKKYDLDPVTGAVAPLTAEVQTSAKQKSRDSIAARQPPFAAVRSPSQPVGATTGNTVTRIANFGTYHALVIGNNNYMHLSDLETAINDAQAVSDLMRRKYGFKVKLLKNANRSMIIAALVQFRRQLKTSDNLLIYYAGHGELDRGTGRGYWLPVDAERDNPANWIANDDVTNHLKAMHAKHVLVVADSCYSGTLTRSPGTQQIRTGGAEEWVMRMAGKRSRTVLTSGGLEPVLDSGAGDHSVFAKAFLETLKDNDTSTDMDAIYQEIKLWVVANADQVPVYGVIRIANHEFGDFVFAPQ